MQARGSALGQACLEQRGVYKAGDNLSSVVDVQIDRATKRLSLKQRSGDILTGPRMTEISNALNGCRPFKDLLFAESGLTTFQFTFDSGR